MNKSLTFLISLILLISAPSFASSAIIDIFDKELPFEISIPVDWAVLPISKIYEGNKLAPQTKSIQGFHLQNSEYPNFLIFDKETPLSKIKNSIEAKELVRIINQNNLKKDLNTELKNNHEYSLSVGQVRASYDEERGIVFIHSKNNYDEVKILIIKTVIFIREKDPLVLGFYSLENEYKKDSIIFDEIINSISFPESITTDSNSTEISSEITLTNKDVTSFLSYIFLMGIFSIIFFVNRKKAPKK